MEELGKVLFSQMDNLIAKVSSSIEVTSSVQSEWRTFNLVIEQSRTKVLSNFKKSTIRVDVDNNRIVQKAN